jgi:hypothetical protein
VDLFELTHFYSGRTEVAIRPAAHVYSKTENLESFQMAQKIQKTSRIDFLEPWTTKTDLVSWPWSVAFEPMGAGIGVWLVKPFTLPYGRGNSHDHRDWCFRDKFCFFRSFLVGNFGTICQTNYRSMESDPNC